MKTFQLVDRENTDPDVSFRPIGSCAICDGEITNFENSFADAEENKRICMVCASQLSWEYKKVFESKVRADLTGEWP